MPMSSGWPVSPAFGRGADQANAPTLSMNLITEIGFET